MVTAALLAAFTCIATMIIKIPTPTFGYIHLGDGLVLLCGIILGPGIGALAAGIGSMFADIFSGYMTWAPATLIIMATSCLKQVLLHLPAVLSPPLLLLPELLLLLQVFHSISSRVLSALFSA